MNYRQNYTQENLVLATDSYKVGHKPQYPAGTRWMSDFMASRGGKHSFVVPFGLQYFRMHYLAKQVTLADVNEARAIFADHFGRDDVFPYEDWLRVVNVHGGYLPLRIRAVPEGTVVRTGTPFLQVESTDPFLWYLPSWYEGVLQKTWYPTTVATLDFFTKIEMLKRLRRTSDNADAVIPFMLHDFGYRGTSSDESARIGGGAALVNFMGTDTVPALTWLRDYYAEKMAGFSIVASEHSTITTWGLHEAGETAAYANMIEKFGHHNVFACVSDSKDIYNAVEHIWGGTLRERVQQMNATLVVRPDSGEPVAVISKVLTLLDEKFGSTPNSKGFKVLNKVRVIQGDGIGHEGEIAAILDAAIGLGFSAENLAFGMGGGRLQKMDRDTQKFAIKCSAANINGEFTPVYKDPITDAGKRSPRGYVDAIYTDEPNHLGVPKMVDNLTGPHAASAMRLVFENGHNLEYESFSDIRARVAASLGRFMEQ